MKTSQKRAMFVIVLISMIILMVDPTACIKGCKEGIDLCYWVLIPALFPFLVFSTLLCSMIEDKDLKKIGKIFPLHHDCVPYFILGLLAGYPSGAVMIANAYHNRRIDMHSANHMLYFCNNAGPGFILGMSAILFSSFYLGWIIWGIHMIAALCVSFVFHSDAIQYTHVPSANHITLSDSLKKTIHTVGIICTWVILFRALLAVIHHWFGFIMTTWAKTLLAGFLELSNGIASLQQIESEPVRFLLFIVFLGFGGICVLIQTASIIGELQIKHYLHGKIVQCAVSILFATPLSYVLFDQHLSVLTSCILIILSLACIILFSILNMRNNCSIIDKKKPISRIYHNKEIYNAVS